METVIKSSIVVDIKQLSTIIRERAETSVISLHTLLGRIFHSNASHPFWHTLHEKSQLSTSGVWISRHLCSYEFFTRSALLLLYILPTLPFLSPSPVLSSKAGLRLFSLSTHVSWVSADSVGRFAS